MADTVSFDSADVGKTGPVQIQVKDLNHWIQKKEGSSSDNSNNRYSWVDVTIVTKIVDPKVLMDTTGKIFTWVNNAGLTPEPSDDLYWASSNASLSHKAMSKEMVYNSGNAPNAAFTIDYNPDTMDINPYGETIDIYDTSSSTLQVSPDSIRVIDAANNRPLQKGTDYTVDMSHMGGENTFIVTVPDERHLTIRYTAEDGRDSDGNQETTSGGPAVFRNSYQAQGQAALKAKKELKGAKLAEGQFSFELKDAEGKVLQTKTNAADGSITFDNITYTQADLGADGKGSITYEISEVPGDAAGYSYASNKEKVTVELTDHRDGTIETKVIPKSKNGRIIFVNTYEEPAVEKPDDTAEEYVEPDEPDASDKDRPAGKTEKDKKKDRKDKKSKSPLTGDAAELVPEFACLIGSSIMLIILAILGKRQK